MKKYAFFLLVLALTACQQAKQPIVIFFENDVHCAIDDYAKFSALRNQAKQHTPYVAVVSAGDFAQGAAIGSLSQGESIIKVMNAVKYDATTVGNHEFDYGIPQQQHLMRELNAKVLCCNFSDLDGNLLYKPYSLHRFGQVTVAFVGAATPTTFNSSTPTYFEDGKGNFIYSFHADDSFALIQAATNDARKHGADYVIVLSHLGDDTALDNSVDMIRTTVGIDAVLDGHQHHILNLKVPNAQGDSVILASTGTQFQRFGKLTIDTAGLISVELIENTPDMETDPKVERVIAQIKADMQSMTSKVVGYSQVPLTMLKNGKREVRRGETNLTDFLTDAFRDATGADIGVMNGGGVRNQLPAGEITYGDIYSVIPFNNTMRMLQCTGQQLLDALEVGVAHAPDESGDFIHVSGMRYTYTTAIPSSVMLDHNQLFIGIGKTRRIISAEIERNGQWIPVDPNATYTIGGQSYILTCKGAAGAFQYMKEIDCNHVGDVEAVLNYLDKLGTVSAEQYAEPQLREQAL